MRFAGLREWLARKLAPETFRDAERYDYLRHRLGELQQWCGHEAPEVDHALDWAFKSMRVHFMPLNEYYEHCAKGDFQITQVGGIDRFREELRARANRAA